MYMHVNINGKMVACTCSKYSSKIQYMYLATAKCMLIVINGALDLMTKNFRELQSTFRLCHLKLI